MRFAHISDLHFGSFTMSPFQFFSKRWLGNFNYLLTRKRRFDYRRLIELIDLFKAQEISHVIITGDLSVTARPIEFKMAKKFVKLLENEGITVFLVPGNHDQYTKRSQKKKRFYKYFDSRFDTDCPFNLIDHKVTYTPLANRLWLVGLDTAVATSIFSSQGHFSPLAEEHLEKALRNIPKEDTVILFNHFPFFQNDTVKKQLMRGTVLKNLLQKHPNVQLYLHGHAHRQTVADLRPNDLPIISVSGSTPHVKDGACHLFELSDNEIKLDVLKYEDEWKITKTHNLSR